MGEVALVDLVQVGDARVELGLGVHRMRALQPFGKACNLPDP